MPVLTTNIGGGFGQFPFGEAPFGGAPITGTVQTGGGPPPPPPAQAGVTVTILSLTDTTGPFITVSYTVVNSNSLAQQQARIQLINNTTNQSVYDTGWLVQVLASGSTGSFTIDLIDQHIPLNTTGGTYTLAVSSSPSQVDPSVSGFVGIGNSAPFDILWGSPILTWVNRPSNTVEVTDGTQSTVNTTWGYSDVGGFAQGFWEVVLSSPDGSNIYYDTALMSGTNNTVAIPGIVANTSYLITVIALNTNGVPATNLTANFFTGQPIVLSPVTGGFLQRFTALLGYELDTNRSLLEALRDANDPLLCPGNLLPALAQELGVEGEAGVAIGMTQLRKLLSGIVHQYKIKGTLPGIAGISTALTGWASTIDVGQNLLLTSFPFYMGGTSGSGAALTVSGPGNVAFPANPSTTTIPAANWPAVWPTALDTLSQTLVATVYTGGVSSALVAIQWGTAPPSSGVLAKINSVSPAALSISGHGIPVSDLSTVAFSTYIWVSGFGTSFALIPSIGFYDQTGTFISAWTGSATSTFTQATHTSPVWTQVSGSAISVPDGSVWAILRFIPTPTTTITNNTSTVIFAGQYFGAAPYTTYQEPRTLNISLLSDRVNYLANPSFEGLEVPGATPPVAGGTLFGWAAVANCSLSLSSSISFPVPSVPRPGIWSCTVTASSAGNMSVLSSKMPIDSEFLYTASMYVLARTVARQVNMTMLFYDASNNLLQTVSGDEIFELVGEWVRPFAQVNPGTIVNPEATQAALELTWVGCASSEAHNIDCALFEPVWALRPYFDAGLYSTSTPPIAGADYIWAGDANHLVNSGSTVSIAVGPSYYYHNYPKKYARLNNVLGGLSPALVGQSNPLTITGFLPAGVPYNLITPASI